MLCIPTNKTSLFLSFSLGFIKGFRDGRKKDGEAVTEESDPYDSDITIHRRDRLSLTVDAEPKWSPVLTPPF